MATGSDRGGRAGATRRRGMRLRDVRDPRAARRWFVFDVVFIVAAVVAVVVFWSTSPDNTGGGTFFTVIALAMIANTAWEMRKLWPVTGWSRPRGAARDG